MEMKGVRQVNLEYTRQYKLDRISKIDAEIAELKRLKKRWLQDVSKLDKKIKQEQQHEDF